MPLLASNKHLNLYRQYYAARSIPRAQSALLPQVESLATRVGARTLIDYGCGAARGLSFSTQLTVTDYDLGVAGLEATPPPHDMVASIHMLEHVEPDTVDAVIAHIELLAVKAVFIVVSCKPSTKTLPDGSPWHSLVRSPAWWANKLGPRYKPQPVRSANEYAALWVKSYGHAA